MAKRKSLKEDDCPVARALDVVGDRWSMLIVRDAFDGINRFGAFQKSLGVARNILSERLSTLVSEGILVTQAASDGTSYPEYVLTDKGRGLFATIVALRQWGEGQLFAPGEQRSHLIVGGGDGIGNGKPSVATLEVRTTDGRLLLPERTQVMKVAR